MWSILQPIRVQSSKHDKKGTVKNSDMADVRTLSFCDNHGICIRAHTASSSRNIHYIRFLHYHAGVFFRVIDCDKGNNPNLIDNLFVHFSCCLMSSPVYENSRILKYVSTFSFWLRHTHWGYSKVFQYDVLEKRIPCKCDFFSHAVIHKECQLTWEMRDISQLSYVQLDKCLYIVNAQF